MSTLGNEYLPVAYLPGASGRSTVWEPIANVLAHRREAFLFAYPGLGDAPTHEAIRSLPDLVDWVASELPERCDVVALSMGSTIALKLALDYPERIRRLVLVTPCGGLNVARFGALDWREAFVAARPFAPRWFVTDDSDFSEQLNQITAPTLLVLGEDDAIAPPAIGEFMLERLPNAKLEVVSDATHDLEEEHPAFLASLIEAHLRR
ncbi:MAG TPA: alpha/beta hydrolase [Polyangiaceae bacterium]|jgi:pimeloyl-ACP methyl ester carboxylesterase|nr:alpha/beta hydrolase [Polyangiaceae bacterium]